MATEGEARAEIGIIGGSGFYQMDGITGARRLHVPTPFGDPSSPITIGTLHGRSVAFISRHDEGHRLLPSELPSRANVYALKRLGVRQVLAVSAVGSLREEVAPLHAVVPDQIIDRTNGRASSFFGEGIVAHVAFADPYCPCLVTALAEAAEGGGVPVHAGGTMVVINGPAFSTRAESLLYRSWGASIIGMTAIPEAKLAREAELCYAALCFVTDYDTWHATEANVTADLVLENLRQNVEHAKRIVATTIEGLASRGLDCECGDALGPALITRPEDVPVATRRRLGVLLERYWGPAS